MDFLLACYASDDDDDDEEKEEVEEQRQSDQLPSSSHTVAPEASHEKSSDPHSSKEEKKRKRSSAAADGPPLPGPSKLPPLPADVFGDLQQDDKKKQEELLAERKRHKGRVRRFPHIEGNYPTYVHIPGTLCAPLTICSEGNTTTNHSRGRERREKREIRIAMSLWH